MMRIDLRSMLIVLCAALLLTHGGAARADTLVEQLLDGPDIAGVLDDTTEGVEKGGILFVGTALVGGAGADPVPPPAEAVDRLVKAYQLLLAKSPASRAGIRRLQLAGTVVILFSPNGLAEVPVGSTVARLTRNLFRDMGNAALASAGEAFVLVLGRQPISWDKTQLAPLIAGELLGRGSLLMAGLNPPFEDPDTRCLSGLHREQAAKDLGTSQLDRLAVILRRQLQQSDCLDFRAYLRRIAPAAEAEWDELNPNVARLLTHFEAFQSSKLKPLSGLPKCGDRAALQRLQASLNPRLRVEGVAAGLVTVENVLERSFNEDQRVCSATVQTDAADVPVDYTIRWRDEDKLDVALDLELGRARLRNPGQ